MTRLFLILTFLILTGFGHAQSDNDSLNNFFDDNNPFEIRQINFTILDSNKIKKVVKNINILKTNIICYRGSFWEDTIIIAYSFKDKNKWVSFNTPFHDITYDYKLINIDKKGQPEIVVNGTIIYDDWPYGERRNDAILIYQIDSIPTQILKLFYRCSEFNVGDRNNKGEGASDYASERKVKIENGVLIVEKYVPNILDSNGQTLMDDCHITSIEEGTYKLINGQFKRK